jgi:predicted nucleotidyltransferase
MDKGLRDSLLTVCKLLDKHEEEYLIVGGAAVAFHGYFRISISTAGVPVEKPDLDFWYNPTYINYFNLLSAIEELGEDVSEFKNEKAPDPRKSFFKLNFDTVTIDFLPELPGLSKFRHSYERKEVVNVEGVNFLFINFDDLILNKQTLQREKDISDIEELKRRHQR